jgi:molybdenum ABC transporter molybdate-binding protein
MNPTCQSAASHALNSPRATALLERPGTVRPAVRSCRRGAVSWFLVAGVAAIAVVGLLWSSMLRRSDEGPSNSQPLVILCAASNRSVMEAVRRDYEQAYGAELQIQYGPSQTLLAAAEVSGNGDLFLPADDSYIESARERDLAREVFPLATMRAVVAVAKGNPKKIVKWDDLLRSDVRLAQASTEATAIGKLTRQTLTADQRWDALHARTTVYKTTVNEVANDVKVGAADAGIVFDAVLNDYPELEAVKLPELGKVEAEVAATVLKTSRRPTQAIHFARYLAARDKGLVRYRERGFEAVDGDLWSERPEVTLYAGSMLRPAIEQTISAFEQREGVSVLRVYNGCGILVAQMKAGRVPDAYFACDVEFMNQVKEQFPGSEDVSQNELVIMVKKGNPRGIASLADLAKPHLRVGIGHEKQCAMGWLTQRTFKEGGVQEAVMKNVVVQTPTGDMLVNQMRSGSLDAAVAYLSNAAGAGDSLDAVRIQGLPCSVATQPFGTSKDSGNKRLTERLLAAIRADASREKFASEGFRWIETKAGP